MSLNKLGQYIELNETRNINLELGINDVMGMTITKEIISTKADVKEKELPKFYVCKPLDFIYNPRTHGKKIGLGFNTLGKKFLISWNNISFRVRKDKLKELNPYYLFIWLNRNEWDRNATFRSWGSSTEVFSWDEFCDMDIDVPPITVQDKYVAIYKAMQHNLKVYESKLDDLKLVCDAFIEDLKNKYPLKPLNLFSQIVDERNSNLLFSNVYGLTVYKKFIETKADLTGVSLRNYKIVRKGDIAYVPTTNRNGDKIACALCEEDCIVSTIYETIRLDSSVLPEYVFMWFERKQMDRYARYNSWGSARETISWEDLGAYEIPIPPLSVQKAVADIAISMKQRRKFVDDLKSRISNICPILIKGSIEEAQRS